MDYECSNVFFLRILFLLVVTKIFPREFWALSMTIFLRIFPLFFPDLSHEIVNSSNIFISICRFLATTHVEFESVFVKLSASAHHETENFNFAFARASRSSQLVDNVTWILTNCCEEGESEYNWWEWNSNLKF
jgi:hypothetical protein